MFNDNPLLAAIYQMHAQAQQQPPLRNPSQPADPFAGMNSTEGAAPQQPMLQMPGGPGSSPQSVPYHWLRNQMR